jgi:hypothetical protein
MEPPRQQEQGPDSMEVHSQTRQKNVSLHNHAVKALAYFVVFSARTLVLMTGDKPSVPEIAFVKTGELFDHLRVDLGPRKTIHPRGSISPPARAHRIGRGFFICHAPLPIIHLCKAGHGSVQGSPSDLSKKTWVPAAGHYGHHSPVGGAESG